ncbi:organic cation transporter protein-like isoform X2 [Maniola jurtina]|uniref:organic cation transporter protein-like isoform X2 n=1 Tax=Maniola jurtina TaxID=191418 RepID=UPI001E68A5E4|nr:organic cation transporter protein-like isoform X2 [Maniola jurtina]
MSIDIECSSSSSNDMTEKRTLSDVDKQHGKETNKDEDEKENVTPQPIDLDYLLANELGQFGWFQLRNVLLLALLTLFGGTSSEYIFSAAATPHRCRIPECSEGEKLHEFNPQWINNAIPETSSGFASCERYAPVGTNGSLDYCPANLFDQSNTVACEGFVYANNNTVVYEFDLGCNEWLRAFAGTIQSLGTLLALPITGFISDRFGRRIALVISIVSQGLFGFIRAFSVSYTMYLILQIVQTTFGSGAFSSAFILATELVGPKYRVITGVTLTSMFTLGEVLLGGTAWLIPPWRYVIMVTTIPCFFFVVYYWIITESVRWLLSTKKYTEAKKILHTIARVNKTQISEKSLEVILNPSQLTITKSNADSLGLVRTIIRSPILLRRICTTPLWWMTMTFVYYGLSINSTSLSDTMHLNYMLTSFVSIPGFYSSAFFSNTIGRKFTVAVGFFISAACNISFVFIPRDFAILRLIVYLLGKFFISSVASTLYIYTSELYPTEYRHTFLGFSSMIGRIGSIFAPLTPALMIYYHGLPSLLFGGMGVVAGLLVLTQPETLGCNMPDTLAEAEAIGKPESKIKTTRLST